MSGVWVHTQLGADRVFSQSTPPDKGDQVDTGTVLSWLDEAFNALPKAVRAASSDHLDKLKRRIHSLQGTSVTGSGYGRNFLAEDMAEGWHIDIEISGTVRFL